MSTAASDHLVPSRQGPLVLVATVFREEHEDRSRPGWHDLLVLTLHQKDLQRLLRGYDYALEILGGLKERQLIDAGSDNSSPGVTLPIDLPIALHSSASATGTGWELLDSLHWTAFPAAFPIELLGPPNPEVDRRSSFRCMMQVFERHGAAIIHVETSEGVSDLPAYFITESLPIESIREWANERQWTDAVVTNSQIDYSRT